MHDRPAEGSVDLAVGECAGIDLGIVETKDATEGPFELIAHHGLLIRGGGAQSVEHNDRVGDGGVGIDVVEPDHDTVVLAACGVAGAGTEDGIDDRAVGVKDDAEGVGGGRRRDIGRLGDDHIAGHDVGAADILVERAGIGERDCGGGHCAPKRGGRVDHCGGLLIGDLTIEGTLIDVIIDRSAGPVDGQADDGGIEKADSGNKFGAAGRGRRGREDERQSDEAGRDALPAGAEEMEHVRHSERRNAARASPFLRPQS